MVVSNGLVTPLHNIETTSQTNEIAGYTFSNNFQASFEKEISRRNEFDPDNKIQTPEPEILNQVEEFTKHLSGKPPKVMMGSSSGLDYAPSYLTEFEIDPSVHNKSILIKKKRADVPVDLNDLTGQFVPDNNRFIVKTMGDLDEPLVNIIRKIDGDVNKKFVSTTKGFKGYEKSPIVNYHRAIYTDPSLINQRHPDIIKGEKIISRVYN